MIKLLLISGVVLLFCLLFLCINILFKKNGKFPQSHVSQNKELQKRGIGCIQSQDYEMRHQSKKILEHL